jgi:hypothetical protein
MVSNRVHVIISFKWCDHMYEIKTILHSKGANNKTFATSTIND